MKKKIIITSAIVIWLYFFLSALQSLVYGGIPFWYDPARDLLAAWDNQQKISLIGQPAGIPGVFYGPYWIWLNSLALLFSKNPALVSFLVLTLPYFVGVPIILYGLRKSLGLAALVFMILFFGSYGDYMTSLWNPHLAPLIILLIIFIFARINFSKKINSQSIILSALAGLLSGSLTSFHMSLAIAVIFSLGVIYFLAVLFNFSKGYVLSLLAFIAGVTFALGPTIAFELRHNFMISTSYLHTFINSAVYNSAVVGQTGLNKSQIIANLLQVQAKYLHLPQNIALLLWPVVIVFLFWQKKFKFEVYEKRIILFILLTLFGIIFLCLSSKNPVWDYYFIGVETMLIFLFVLLIKKSSVLTFVFLFWGLILIIPQAILFFYNFPPKYDQVPGLSSKEKVVDTIYKDAKNTDFIYFAYNPSIYTYDYDYLFRWYSQKYSRMPQKDISLAKVVYLIIPQTSPVVYEDFIHYKTPDIKYETQWSKIFADQTSIIKRVLLTN